MFSSFAILGAFMLVPFLINPICSLIDKIGPKISIFFQKLFFTTILLFCVVLSYSQIELRAAVVNNVVVTKEVVCVKLPQTKEEYSQSLGLLLSNLTFVNEETASAYSIYMMLLLEQFGYPEDLKQRFAMVVDDTNYFLKTHHGN